MNLQTFRVFSQHPKWFITPVNPWKVWCIAFFKWLWVFNEFTGTTNHRFLTNQNARTILVIYNLCFCRGRIMSVSDINHHHHHHHHHKTSSIIIKNNKLYHYCCCCCCRWWCLLLGLLALRPSISSLLQNATACFTTKCDSLLLQSATSVITKCDRYYKVRQNLPTDLDLARMTT